MTTYRNIEVTPLTGTIGAEIGGVDLRAPSDEQVAEMHAALMDHLVVFVRGQDLTDDEHIALASHFGTPNIYPPNRARGVLRPLEFIEDDASSPPKADLWHTDVAFLPEPPDIAVLSMRESPPFGGDTLWCNLYGVHDALSPTMQALVADLRLDVHPGPDMAAKITAQFGADVFAKVADEYQGWEQPLVRVHPVTGRRALYMCGAYVRGIVGMHPDEADALLALLRRRLEDPNHHVRWRWRDHDVAIWDERCTNHRAIGDHYPQHRLVRRCTVGAARALGPSEATRAA